MAMTMLQMAGATPTPATMADGVLLIIDAQREYTDGLLPLPGVQPAIDALADLLAGTDLAAQAAAQVGDSAADIPARKASTWVVGSRAGHPVFADYYRDTTG